MNRGRPALQRALSEWSQRLHARGWVANHDGNLSVRLPEGDLFLATPTATSKAFVRPGDVVCVDITGKKVGGRKRLFSEWHLHAACYRARPDVAAVLHAHPRHATALGLCGEALGTPALPELVVSLGPNIPLLDYAPPKSAEQDAAIARALVDDDADALMLAGNGVLVVGADLEQAFLRAELVEHYASIVHCAAAHGGVRPLPADDVEKLCAARTRAGLGKKGRAG